MKITGLGEFKVLSLRECPPTTSLLDTPEACVAYWKQFIATDSRHNPDVESMVVLCLTTRRTIMGHNLCATGTLDTILVHPREIFRAAIVSAASAIVLMHNHPSGNPSPSEGDIKVTRDLIRAGQIIKIEVLDHVIMGKLPLDGGTKDYASLRELGYFYA